MGYGLVCEGQQRMINRGFTCEDLPCISYCTEGKYVWVIFI